MALYRIPLLVTVENGRTFKRVAYEELLGSWQRPYRNEPEGFALVQTVEPQAPGHVELVTKPGVTVVE